MGFLTSSFINLILTREQNRLNAQLTSIMSRIRSAKKQAQNVENMINSQLRYSQNAARANYQQSIFQAQQNAMAQAGLASLTDTSDPTKTSVFTQLSSQLQMQAQSQLQFALSQAEQDAQTMKEMQLQPLNDLAEDLEVRKAQIESELQLNKEWKEAAKEDVKNSAQNLKPNYGGSSA